MLSELAKIYDDGGSLLDVKYALFGGDSKSLTAVGLRFENVSASFRAVPEDDTLAATIGGLNLEVGETLIDASGSSLWSGYLGLNLGWAWQLTNHQRYLDGVRFEFSKPGESSRGVVELIVVASIIQVFVGVPSAAAEQALAADSVDAGFS
jgi:hypothetical protein